MVDIGNVNGNFTAIQNNARAYTTTKPSTTQKGTSSDNPASKLGNSPGAMGGSGLPPQSVVTPQQLETNPMAAYALEGQQMGQSAVATANQNRTDTITESALNKVNLGMSPGGMGGSAIINTGGNVSNVSNKTIAPTTIVNKDPILNLIDNSLAM